jgi:hypothetical protein
VFTSISPSSVFGPFLDQRRDGAATELQDVVQAFLGVEINEHIYRRLSAR